MDLYKYLYFILLTTVCYIDAEFILTEKDYTWSDANRMCTLATPNLNFNENGITPDHTDIPPSADAWLGYIEKMTPFEYFGCAKKSDLGLNTAANYTTRDPGKCWSACNNGRNIEAIAVNENECYCLHTVIADESDLKENNCSKGCPGQPKIVCGNGRNHVSLYKTTDTGTIQASDSDSSICLWYDITLETFHWGNCSEDYSIICYKGNNVSLFDGYGDWIPMTKKCFSDDKIPSNYNNTGNVVTTEKVNMWTGIIRNGVIYPITDPTNVTIGKHGYVDMATGKLSFTTDTTEKKRALCVNGSSDVGAIVGASVAIIIVIIVVIVLVVLWKRGVKFPFKKARKLERENTQATNMTYNFVRPDNTIQGTAESTFNNYAEVDVSKMTPGTGVTENGEQHPYIVLEKGNEGTYGTTKTTTQIHDQHTFNPYNEISLEESSNYDHIGAHANDSKTLGLDNLYNSTTLASSNKYNGLKNNAFKRNDESDDTYNHIDGQLLQAELNQSDNPYNTTALGQYLDHNLQNDHGVTNIAFNSNDECDDTYNHIGDQPGQND